MDCGLFRPCCLLAVLLLATIDVAVSAATGRGDTEIEGSDVPPMKFPSVPQTDSDSEVSDMLKETDAVDHPKVMDPGKTHEQGAENQTSVADNSTAEETSTMSGELETSGIFTCNFPKSWLSSQAANKSSGELTGQMDNDTDCLVPLEWFKANNSVHICTIQKEWLNANNYTIQNGSISKELLAETNTTNIRCVTPMDAVKGDDLTSNSTSLYSNVLPSTWLKKGNSIYIYLVTENTTEAELPDNSTANLETSSVTSPPAATASINITSDVTAVKVLSDSKETTTILPSSTSTVQAPKINTPTGEGVPKKNATVDDSEKNKTVKKEEQKSPETTEKKLPPPSPSSSSSSSTTTTTTTTAPTSTLPITKSSTATSAKSSSSSVSADVEAENEVVTTPSSPAALLQRHAEHDHSSTSGKTAFLQPTESAAILAGVFVGIALLGYVGLLVWRRILERRYGHREMLVNEDDDFDTSDMRHFEMQNTRSSPSVSF